MSDRVPTEDELDEKARETIAGLHKMADYEFDPPVDSDCWIPGCRNRATTKIEVVIGDEKSQGRVCRPHEQIIRDWAYRVGRLGKRTFDGTTTIFQKGRDET